MGAPNSRTLLELQRTSWLISLRQVDPVIRVGNLSLHFREEQGDRAKGCRHFCANGMLHGVQERLVRLRVARLLERRSAARQEQGREGRGREGRCPSTPPVPDGGSAFPQAAG